MRFLHSRLINKDLLYNQTDDTYSIDRQIFYSTFGSEISAKFIIDQLPTIVIEEWFGSLYDNFSNWNLDPDDVNINGTLFVNEKNIFMSSPTFFNKLYILPQYVGQIVTLGVFGIFQDSVAGRESIVIIRDASTNGIITTNTVYSNSEVINFANIIEFTIPQDGGGQIRIELQTAGSSSAINIHNVTMYVGGKKDIPLSFYKNQIGNYNEFLITQIQRSENQIPTRRNYVNITIEDIDLATIDRNDAINFHLSGSLAYQRLTFALPTIRVAPSENFNPFRIIQDELGSEYVNGQFQIQFWGNVKAYQSIRPVNSDGTLRDDFIFAFKDIDSIGNIKYNHLQFQKGCDTYFFNNSYTDTNLYFYNDSTIDLTNRVTECSIKGDSYFVTRGFGIYPLFQLVQFNTDIVYTFKNLLLKENTISLFNIPINSFPNKSLTSLRIENCDLFLMRNAIGMTDYGNRGLSVILKDSFYQPEGGQQSKSIIFNETLSTTDIYNLRIENSIIEDFDLQNIDFSDIILFNKVNTNYKNELFLSNSFLVNNAIYDVTYEGNTLPSEIRVDFCSLSGTLTSPLTQVGIINAGNSFENLLDGGAANVRDYSFNIATKHFRGGLVQAQPSNIVNSKLGFPVYDKTSPVLLIPTYSTSNDWSITFNSSQTVYQTPNWLFLDPITQGNSYYLSHFYILEYDRFSLNVNMDINPISYTLLANDDDVNYPTDIGRKTGRIGMYVRFLFEDDTESYGNEGFDDNWLFVELSNPTIFKKEKEVFILNTDTELPDSCITQWGRLENMNYNNGVTTKDMFPLWRYNKKIKAVKYKLIFPYMNINSINKHSFLGIGAVAKQLDINQAQIYDYVTKTLRPQGDITNLQISGGYEIPTNSSNIAYNNDSILSFGFNEQELRLLGNIQLKTNTINRNNKSFDIKANII